LRVLQKTAPNLFSELHMGSRRRQRAPAGLRPSGNFNFILSLFGYVRQCRFLPLIQHSGFVTPYIATSE